MHIVERANRKIILQFIWKHRLLSNYQIARLLDVKIETIRYNIKNYKSDGYVDLARTHKGIYYFLTTKGVKYIGGLRARKFTSINDVHTDAEIEMVHYMIDNKIIDVNTYQELFDSYKTDRQIKKEKWSAEGMKAKNLRYVDLEFKGKNGKASVEVELNAKTRKRYKVIQAKLNAQFIDEKWKILIWVINDHVFNNVKGKIIDYISPNLKGKVKFIKLSEIMKEVTNG